MAIFWVLIFAPTPFDSVPFWPESFDEHLDAAWHHVSEVVALPLGLEVPPVQVTGSGDTLARWLQMLGVVMISALLGLSWSIDRTRTNDEAVADFARDYARLGLSVAMVVYGASKTFGFQMPLLNDVLAGGTYAESSPMGLLWRFMGFSPFYQHFAGALELGGGLLLTTRRTTTLGALVSIAALTNVVLVNFCFDVPVKLYSSLYLLTALFLAWPDVLKLLAFLLLRISPVPRDESAKYLTGWRVRWVRRAVFPLAAISALVHTVGEMNSDGHQTPVTTSMKGVYVPLSQSPATLWSRVSLTGNFLRVDTFDHSKIAGRYTPDEGKHLLHFKSFDQPPVESDLHWDAAGDDVHLSGNLGGKEIDLHLRNTKPSEGLLMTRGFHWVQEFPLNR